MLEPASHRSVFLSFLTVLAFAAASVSADPQETPTKVTDRIAFAKEVAKSCDSAEEALRIASSEGDFSLKAEDLKTLCKDKSPKDCWQALAAGFLKGVDEKVKEQLAKSRSHLLDVTLDTGSRVERVTRELQGHSDRVLSAVLAALNKHIPGDKEIDVGSETAVATANAALAPAAQAVAQEFAKACNASSSSVIASFQAPGEQLQIEAEASLFRSLTEQKEGFSRQVRCVLREITLGTDKTDLQLTCEPGLLLSGEEISEISVLVEGGSMWLSRAQAVTSDELPFGAADAIHTCASGDPEHELTCDVIRIGEEVRAIAVAVHKIRTFSPTYGCKFRQLNCARRRLRPSEPRSRLSLALTGAAPSIHIIVEDIFGRVAAARIPVGYARWKVEMGGFFAVTPLTDRELITETVAPSGEGGSSSGPTMTKVVGILNREQWGQETGVYTNFIPSNYEFFGISLGFAARSGKPPSVYLGPNLRLRSFGGKGLASIGGGVVMRSVDRFPGIKVGDEFAPDSSRLQPVVRQQFDYFVAVNLGFRFGPVGVNSEGE
jgi:hypothetical protein